jgi:hypothetical protein
MRCPRAVLDLAAAALAACTAHRATSGASRSAASRVPTAAAPPPARYLYVWAGDKDEKDSDFMAVVDVAPGSATYGEVVATEPVGMGGTLPHHTEYELPARGRLLFANGHHHEQIFLFDTDSAERPRLVRALPPVPPYRYPHDFLRLPSGNVLVGFLRSEARRPATPCGRAGTAGWPS